MEIVSRSPTIQDLADISQIFSQAIKGNFKADIRLKEIEDEADNLIEELINNVAFTLNSEGGNEFYLIAISQKKIIGIIGYGKANSLIIEQLNIDVAGVPEIKSVYIHPDFQGKGVGSFLLEKIVSELKNKKISRFCLDSGFKNAQVFWTKKLGAPKRTLKDYWAKGVDHMIWMAEIDKLEFNTKTGT